MKTLLALSAAFLLALCSGCHRAPAPQNVDTAVSVHTVFVEKAASDAGTTVAGVVQAHSEVDLSAQIVAPVLSVTKREGDAVSQGQVLIRLSAPALDASAAQASAALEASTKEESAASSRAQLAGDALARYAELRERHSVTPYELDQKRSDSITAVSQQQAAMAQVAAARSSLAAQSANRANAVLRAPFDGVVTHRFVDPGALAMPGTPLLHLQSRERRDVVFNVPEDASPQLRPGSIVSIRADSNGAATPATVADVAPASDPISHSFVVKATLPMSSRWQPGIVLQVQLPQQQHASVLLVPAQALLQQGGLDAVLVVGPDRRAEVRYVSLGAARGSTTEVLTGLRPGEELVTPGNLAVAGKRVEARP